jgi:amino acid permease
MTACVTVEVIADISMRYWNDATPAMAWIIIFFIGLITAMLVSTHLFQVLFQMELLKVTDTKFSHSACLVNSLGPKQSELCNVQSSVSS